MDLSLYSLINTDYIENREYSTNEVSEYIYKHDIQKMYYLAGFLACYGMGLTAATGNIGRQTSEMTLLDMAASFAAFAFIPYLFGFFCINALEFPPKHYPYEQHNLKCSGIELVNFLNDYSKTDILSFGYIKARADAIDKLINHQYDNENALTVDELSWYSWPGAVLNVDKEDLNLHHHTLETISSGTYSPLISNLTLEITASQL